ncbi:hypothetical protein BD414DRAFT_490400 [Trametes punicea]|nr:hypothetical protein BD414DRAFT_490400 [Trametes punicea]
MNEIQQAFTPASSRVQLQMALLMLLEQSVTVWSDTAQTIACPSAEDSGTPNRLIVLPYVGPALVAGREGCPSAVLGLRLLFRRGGSLSRLVWKAPMVGPRLSDADKGLPLAILGESWWLYWGCIVPLLT